jgi:hypothetical protein
VPNNVVQKIGISAIPLYPAEYGHLSGIGSCGEGDESDQRIKPQSILLTIVSLDLSIIAHMAGIRPNAWLRSMQDETSDKYREQIERTENRKPRTENRSYRLLSQLDRPSIASPSNHHRLWGEDQGSSMSLDLISHLGSQLS